MKRWLTLAVQSMAIVSVCFAQAQEAPVAAHVLFDFEEGAAGWHANVYGKGKLWAERASDARAGRGAIAVHLRDLHGANLISPPILFGQPWRQQRYDRVRFWARADKPMTTAKFVFVTDEAEHNTYSLQFSMQEVGWHRHTYPLARCWNRGKKKINASRITRMYINGSGTADFAVDQVELLEAAREVHLRPDRHVFVFRTRTPPAIDGQLNDPAWQGAAHLTDFLRYRSDKPAVDQTEAWVTYDDQALYVAARLYTRTPDELKAIETARDASVWQDDCLEIFVDPQHTHSECYQFVANSIGSQFDALLPGGGKGRGRAWNGTWTVKTAVDKDAWLVEMRLPFEDFGRRPESGETWGFNVCREAPSSGELSFWTDTGGKFTRVRGLADLVFATAVDKGVGLTNVRLEEKAPGSYVLRGDTRSPRASRAAYTVWTQSPEDVKTSAVGHVSIAAGRSDVAIPVEFEAKEEGEAKAWFALRDAKTEAILCYKACNFNVAFSREADLSRLVLVPTPKEMGLGDGEFNINGDTITHIGSDRREAFIGEVIEREIEECYGVRSCVRRPAPRTADNVILVGRPDTSPALKRALAERGLLERLEALKPEGYVLVVEPKRTLIAGKDAQGTYYAARTFLQLVANGTNEGEAPRARCCTIVDWPDFPFRGFMIYTGGWPQDPQDADLLMDFVYKEVAGYKYNAIVWSMGSGYRYSRWPRLRNRCALPRETVQAVARFARNHFIQMIPSTNILGHANWIVLKYPDLKEDGKNKVLCTRHPMTYPLLFDTLDEMLDVFDYPTRLHVGLDEVRWKTFNLPEDERCPRCRGVPKWKIYADHVTKLHGFLKAKGVETWMWGDMLIPRHNGGPPFNCYKALDLIPKDVVICNWSAEYAKGSSRELVEKGFRVVKANSRQVPVSEQPYVFGNLASLWYRCPWCTMNHVGQRGLMMEIAFAADYSWNVNRENVTLKRYARERDLNILRLVARPGVPGGCAEYTPLDLSEVANRTVVDEAAGDGEGWADLGPEQDRRRQRQARGVSDRGRSRSRVHGLETQNSQPGIPSHRGSACGR